VKIVKEIEDHDFFCNPQISTPEYRGRYTWYWGLGDNGRIYYRCTRFAAPDEWHSLQDNTGVAAEVSLKTMKKLVKQFGHLLVFT
jgi:hypothetical protein